MFGFSGRPTLINVIIANNSGGDCVNLLPLNPASANNLIETAGNACGLTDGVNGNIIGADPTLGPLAGNGGATPTHALLPSSPAIDAGADASCPTTDQRGMPRPRGAHCDIGAFEAEAFYTLSVNVVGSGTVSPTGGSYLDGTPVSLEATPAAGWQFGGWSGDLSGSANPADLTMDGDKVITATFTMTHTTFLPLIYVSSDSNGEINGISFADEDILAYDPNSDSWAKFFDGSDVGLNSADVNAFFLLDDGSLLISLDQPQSLPGLGQVDDSDIVRFISTSWGETTAGSFEWYFDGSDVGLTVPTEDVDNITFGPDGKLVISTIGRFDIPGVGGQNEDLVAFTPTQLGQNTSGAWSLYFDGSDLSSQYNMEAISSAWIDPANGDIYLTTEGSFSIPGLSGGRADIILCHPVSLGDNSQCTLSFYWDGSDHGLGNKLIDGLFIGGPAAVEMTLTPLTGLDNINTGAGNTILYFPLILNTGPAGQ
jgi:hypothetical protein